MNYVKSLNILGTEAAQIPCLTGKGAPGTGIEAAVGCLYMDTDTGVLYKCVAVDGGVFAWEEAGSVKATATKFTGLKVLVTGDSITEKNYTSTKTWHSYLKDWLGFGEVINDGKSDTGLVKCNSIVPSVKGIVDRIDSYDDDLDLVLIMGNMNDGAIDLPVGTFDQNTEDDRYTSVYGAMHYILKTLIARYPTTPIGFISSTPRWNCYGTDSWFYTDYLPALKRTCEHYGVPFLDLYSGSQLRPWNGVSRAKYFGNDTYPTGDGIHPNAEGHYLMARAILPFVEQHCSPNVTKDFAENKPLVACKGITLPARLSLDPGKRWVLTATVTPESTTDIVRWTSSNNAVATVADGVVVAVGTGNCTITAECGDYRAECAVEVSTLVYSLPAKKEFSGTEGSVDTGVKLMDNDRDFTLLIEFAGGNSDGTNGNVDSVAGGNVPLVCACTNDNSRGVALYILPGNNKYVLNYCANTMALVGNDTETRRFVFRHAAGSDQIMISMASLMAGYPDGYPLKGAEEFALHDNTLRLGAAPGSADYWYGRINDFKVWYEVLDNETVGELLA